jgi:hypothetical protein
MQVARVAFAFSVIAAMPLRAQSPEYDAATLACARFRETVRGELRGNLAGVTRNERVGRDGVLQLRAIATGDGLTIEAWYDSLWVYREGPEGHYEPDAGGMIGGRYRGRLDPHGGYQADARPFIPDGVREVFDLSTLMQDFLPRLPRDPLRAGADRVQGAGNSIWRLTDSTSPEGPIERYRWARRAEWTDTLRQDGPAVLVLRREAEEGSVGWQQGTGPLGWNRVIRAEALVAGGARGRTGVTQEVTVRRTGNACEEPSR